MKPTIKLPFKEFIQTALTNLKNSRYPELDPSTVKFMKTHSYEGDGECYEIPDYIEIQVESQ